MWHKLVKFHWQIVFTSQVIQWDVFLVLCLGTLKFVEHLSLESFFFVCFVSLDKSALLHSKCLMLKFSEIIYWCVEKYFLLFIRFCMKLFAVLAVLPFGHLRRYLPSTNLVIVQTNAMQKHPLFMAVQDNQI